MKSGVLTVYEGLDVRKICGALLQGVQMHANQNLQPAGNVAVTLGTYRELRRIRFRDQDA